MNQAATAAPPATRRGLVGDVGGTNVRFAIASLAADGAVELTAARTLQASDHATAGSALAAYLGAMEEGSLDFASVACAGPVVSGRVSFTNLDWSFGEDDLRQAAGVGHALLLNDLAAVAWSTPALSPSHLHPIGDISASPGEPATVAVLGVGTGVNASAMARAPSGAPSVIVGEAGHASFAPSDEVEMALWRRLRQRFGRVSNERLLSGPGLRNLYEALCDEAGVQAETFSPAEMDAKARSGDRIAEESLIRFCSIMGAVAGDIALTFGARGGVHIAGGVAPRILPWLERGEFRRAFEDKGRFAPYLAGISTQVILHPQAALIGAAQAAQSRETDS